MPRILSPAYFHHYNAQPLSVSPSEATKITLSGNEEGSNQLKVDKLKGNDKEQLVLGMGPVQTSVWRLSRLVPLEGVKRQFSKYTGRKVDPVKSSSVTDAASTPLVEDNDVEPQLLEIEEGLDGVSLKPLSDEDKAENTMETGTRVPEKSNMKSSQGQKWQQVPYLPQYVPFGQV